MSPCSLSTSPSRFLRNYLVFSCLIALVMLGASTYGVAHLHERFVVNLAESNATSLASSIATAQEKTLKRALDNTDFNRQNLKIVDASLRAFLEPYGIVKIKLFSPQRVIVYSTDPSVIGRPSLNNPDLEKALKGGSSSAIQTKDQIHDLTNEERFNVDVVESYVAMRSPAGEVIGAFEIYQDMTQFRDEVHEGVMNFAIGLGLVLLVLVGVTYCYMRSASDQLLDQQKMLEHLATIDPVTNTYNRAEITRKIDAEWERIKRGNPDDNGFGLLMLDLDFFKRVNDSYGHLVGDELLRRVAHRLQGELRQYSDIGRYGGEEFIVILPDVTPEQLRKTGERIIRLVGSEPYVIHGKEITITASGGVSVSRYTDLNIDTVIKRADDNLYRAKAEGRNQVCSDIGPATV